MADELKPCPFCGGSAVKFWDNEWLRAVVECSNCGATTARQDDYPEAITAWNTRAAPPPEPSEAWQPIETAPKDGTEILVGKRINGEWRVCQAAWCYFPGHDNHVQGYEFDVWWWNSDADWGGITDDEGPTDWMPLPQPPAIAALRAANKEKEHG